LPDPALMWNGLSGVPRNFLLRASRPRAIQRWPRLLLVGRGLLLSTAGGMVGRKERSDGQLERAIAVGSHQDEGLSNRPSLHLPGKAVGGRDVRAQRFDNLGTATSTQTGRRRKCRPPGSAPGRWLPPRTTPSLFGRHLLLHCRVVSGLRGLDDAPADSGSAGRHIDVRGSLPQVGYAQEVAPDSLRFGRAAA
jgi:hypothetical protein